MLNLIYILKDHSHVNVWQNPLKCCEVISLQLIKKKKKRNLQQQQKKVTLYNYSEIEIEQAYQ